jgi:hypothetical protein
MDTELLQKYSNMVKKALDRIYFNNWGQSVDVNLDSNNVLNIVLPVDHNIQDPNSPNHNASYNDFTFDIVDYPYDVMKILGISEIPIITNISFNHTPPKSLKETLSKIEFIAKEYAKHNHPFIDWSSIKVIPKFYSERQPMELVVTFKTNKDYEVGHGMSEEFIQTLYEYISNNEEEFGISLDEYLYNGRNVDN